MLEKHNIRAFHIWLIRSFDGILLYRLEGNLYLVLSRTCPIIIILLFSVVSLHE